MQATEPAALVALLQGCEAAVLVGDPRQLPPTVVSTQAGPYRRLVWNVLLPWSSNANLLLHSLTQSLVT